MRRVGFQNLIGLLVGMPIAISAASAAETDEWLEDIGLKQSTKPAAAKAAFKSSETSQERRLPTARRPISSSDLAFIGEENPEKLAAFGEKHLVAHNYDKAIAMFERAIELEDELHTRCLYAEALEGKLKSVSDQDPILFNRCVKQWFYIFKHSDFQEDSKKAAAHLKALTGRAPTLVSLPGTYLPTVLLPESDGPAEPQQVY